MKLSKEGETLQVKLFFFFPFFLSSIYVVTNKIVCPVS